MSYFHHHLHPPHSPTFKFFFIFFFYIFDSVGVLALIFVRLLRQKNTSLYNPHCHYSKQMSFATIRLYITVIHRYFSIPKNKEHVPPPQHPRAGMQMPHSSDRPPSPKYCSLNESESESPASRTAYAAKPI